MNTIRVTVRTTVCPSVAIATRSNPSMRSPPVPRMGGSGIECLDRPLENLFDQPARVDFPQQSAVAVVLDQRRRLPVVGLDPLSDDILPVVRADDEGRAAFVADPRLFGRIHEYVVHGVV